MFITKTDGRIEARDVDGNLFAGAYFLDFRGEWVIDFPGNFDSYVVTTEFAVACVLYRIRALGPQFVAI